MSFSSFYSVVNAIKDKSAEAMTTLSSDLQDFKSIVQEDVAELSKTMRQNLQDGRLSVERRDSDEQESTTVEDEETQEKDVDPTTTTTAIEDQDVDPLTSLRNSLFSFSMSNSLTSVGTSVQGSLTSVQDSLTSVGSKLTSLNVGNSLESLEAMGSKLLNSADEFLGTLAGDTIQNDDEDEGVSESELGARRYRLLALQEDSETYIQPPLDVETFAKWQRAISTDELAEIQKEVVETYPTVGTKFTELVPSVVEGHVFWMHYLYKASLLAAQEQRGAHLLEHALNGDDEEETSWDVDSPKAIDETSGTPFFPDDESKEEEKASLTTCATNGPTSSSDGESWIELEERKDATSPGTSASLNEPTSGSALTDLKLDEGDEAADEDALDWGDDDNLLVPEVTTGETGEVQIPKATRATHEDAAKRGEDWGEWD